MSLPLALRLRAPDPETRRAACLETAADPAAALYVDTLLDILGDPVEAVARGASDALVAIARASAARGGDDAGVVSALRAALLESPPARRLRAALTSARLAPAQPRLLPILVDALGWTDRSLRWAAARALVATAEHQPEVPTLLVGLVRSGEPAAARRMAAHCLRELAPGRPECEAALLAATRDPDLLVRKAALTAAAAVSSPSDELLARLEEVLESSDDPPSRRIAAVVLGALAARRPGALPDRIAAALDRAAHASDPLLARAATRARAAAGGSEEDRVQG